MTLNRAALFLALCTASCAANAPVAAPNASPTPTPPIAQPVPPAPSPSTFMPSPIAVPNIPTFQANVTSFGAVPNDGIDDTAAIQRGLDAVNATGGGTLVFAAGRYDVSIIPALRRALTLYPKLRMLARPGAAAARRPSTSLGSISRTRRIIEKPLLTGVC